MSAGKIPINVDDAKAEEAPPIGGASGGPGALDWATEEEWWRENFSARPYVRDGHTFDDYRLGYRYGVESAMRHTHNRGWSEVETDLRHGWDDYEHRGTNRMTWEEMKEAVRDAWERSRGRV